MNGFIYDIPTKVYFGENQLMHLGKELRRFGSKVLLAYGGGSIKRSGLYDRVVREMEAAGLEWFELSGIEPNPRVSSVNAGAAICKREGIDVLLAVGGGSVIDCAKFIGAAALYDGDAWDILEGKVDVEQCLPVLDILTLAATGSEMDCGGVISNPETEDKIGLQFPAMQPKVSFLDPTLTYSVNKYQTACGAADILSHVLEVYFTMDTDLFLLDTVMEGLMRTVITYAPIALAKPDDYEARANLMWASSWAINGFIRGGKQQPWSCHPIEHELSARYDITHGFGLAVLTPRWMEYVLDESNVSKFCQFGCKVFGIEASRDPMTVARKSIEATRDFLHKSLELQGDFKEIGIKGDDIAIMARKAVDLGDLSHAFKPLAQKDVESIIRMCL